MDRARANGRHTARMLSEPAPGVRLSVIIAAWNGPQALERCLRSLGPAVRSREVEILAVSNFDPGVGLAAAFPRVRFEAMPEGTTVPRLRSAGVAASTGTIIAISEDHCFFDAHWVDAVLRAPLEQHPVQGGAVENAEGQGPLNWAVYFADYGRYMLPCPAGDAAILPGNNVFYPRRVLAAVEASYQDGFFEPVVHGALVAQGYRLYLNPEAVIYHAGTYIFGDTVRLSWHHGRGYGALRIPSSQTGRRLMRAATAPILLILLPARIIVQTVRKGRHIGDLVRSLPVLVALTSAWIGGECMGYLFGAGDSHDRWS